MYRWFQTHAACRPGYCLTVSLSPCVPSAEGGHFLMPCGLSLTDGRVMGLSLVQASPEPDRNGPRRLEVVLEDGGGEGGGEGDGIGSPVGAPWLRYTKAPKAYRELTQAEACAVWLVGLLEDVGEPMKPKEIVKLAKDVGFSRGVVYRAREQLAGVVADTEPHRHPENRWGLVDET